MDNAVRTVCELRDVTYTYPARASGQAPGEGAGRTPGRQALSGVTLRVNEGEWLALIGSNGSGKSTLAKHLNALLVPTQGDCTVYGMSTTDPRNVYAIRSAVSMVFQNPDNQIVGSVVEEDAAFGPENQGLPPDQIEMRVESALLAAGLLAKRAMPTYTLSGGEKQRLAVAGALAMDSPCLVLDEPTAMLDPQGRSEFLAILRSLHEGGKTIVSITHRLEEILYCDRAVVLVEGRLAWEGPVPDLLRQSASFQGWGLDVPPLMALWRSLGMETSIELPDIPTLEGMTAALCR